MHECFHEYMSQLTIRLDDSLAEDVKVHARVAGQSVNSWVVAVLSAAVDPELAGEAAERVRERLARAGLLLTPTGARPPKPHPARLQRAKQAAGAGPPLSDFVSEGRG
jgi:plasmid stability protein